MEKNLYSFLTSGIFRHKNDSISDKKLWYDLDTIFYALIAAFQFPTNWSSFHESDFKLHGSLLKIQLQQLGTKKHLKLWLKPNSINNNKTLIY